MGGIRVGTKVAYKNSLGKFKAECEAAGLRTMQDVADLGESTARELAPKKTGALAASIDGSATGRQARWGTDKEYAMAQEKGARPHTISGSPDLAFFWEKKGRRYIPARVKYRNPDAVSIVNHPGNPGKNYLRDSFRVVMRRVSGILSRNYP